MKKIMTFLTFVTLVLLVSGRGAERTTKLQVETRLFGPALNEQAAKKDGVEPDIVIFARLLQPGLGRGAVGEAESLKRFFNLPELELREEARTAEMVWSEDNRTKKGRLKIDRRLRLAGRDFTVVLVPEEVNGPRQTSFFKLEVHRAAGDRSGSVDVLEKIVAKDFSWNYNGPLVLGFFSQGEAYFLTISVWAKMSSSGGRLGSSISWTL